MLGWVSARTHARANARANACANARANARALRAAGSGRELALTSCSWSPVTSGPRSPTKSVALSKAQRTFKGRTGEMPGKVCRFSSALALAAASVPNMVTKPKPRDTLSSSKKTSPSTSWPYGANSAVRSPDANDSGSPSTKSVVLHRTRTAAAAACTEWARDIARAQIHEGVPRGHVRPYNPTNALQTTNDSPNSLGGARPAGRRPPENHIGPNGCVRTAGANSISSILLLAVRARPRLSAPDGTWQLYTPLCCRFASLRGNSRQTSISTHTHTGDDDTSLCALSHFRVPTVRV